MRRVPALQKPGRLPYQNASDTLVEDIHGVRQRVNRKAQRAKETVVVDQREGPG